MTSPQRLPESASAFYTRGQRLSAAGVLLVRSVWRRMSLNDIDGSWSVVSAQALSALAALQVVSAREAGAYVADVLEEQGMDAPAVATVVPLAFARGSSGLPLADVLATVPAAVKRSVGSGARDQALRRGLTLLEGIAETQIADAARLATSAGMVARPAVTSWTRVLNLPSCGRCAVLAGREYRWSSGFARHPRCFPAGVVVSGPAVDAATRRWYEGELVVIRTASGKSLPLTGNHPVLTGKGWVPANLLVKGDDVVSRASGDRAVGLVVPDEDQVPARIEDVWCADGVTEFGRMPVATEDFHGDRTGGQVDVVLANGLLRRYMESSVTEQLTQPFFTAGSVTPAPLATLSAANQFSKRPFALADDLVGGGDLLTKSFCRRISDARMPCLTPTADRHSVAHQATTNGVATHSERSGDGVLALPGGVPFGQLQDVNHVFTPRWDAPPGPMTVQTRMAYASRGHDLLFRLASQVELDRVVEVSRMQWSGHVFNLSSAEGWYDANGLIVSNCDCRHLPSTVAAPAGRLMDPRAYFDSLSVADQDRYFGKGVAERVRGGGDVSSEVNESRDRWRPRLAGERAETRAAGSPSAPSPQTFMESLIADVNSRGQAIRNLADAGYIAA